MAYRHILRNSSKLTENENIFNVYVYSNNVCSNRYFSLRYRYIEIICIYLLENIIIIIESLHARKLLDS